MVSKHSMVLLGILCVFGLIYACLHLSTNRIETTKLSESTPIPSRVIRQSLDKPMSLSITTAKGVKDKKRLNPADPGSTSTLRVQLGVRKDVESSKVSDVHLSNPFAATAEGLSPSGRSSYSTEQLSLTPVDQAAPTSLSASLIKAALDDDQEETADLVAIDFNLSPLTGRQYLPIPAVVSIFDVVYAQITTLQTCETCIIKWQQRGSEEIEILAFADLSPNRLHTVFVTPENGWIKGQYLMSVYDAGQSNRLLGRNSIYISDVLAESSIRAPDNEFIQTLLNQGHAVSKINPYQNSIFNIDDDTPNYLYIQNLLNSGEAVAKFN